MVTQLPGFKAGNWSGDKQIGRIRLAAVGLRGSLGGALLRERLLG